MSKKSRRSSPSSSTNMLKTLETIKSTEFGDKEIYLTECTLLARSKRNKRQRDNSSETLSNVKKRKAEEHVSNDVKKKEEHKQEVVPNTETDDNFHSDVSLSKRKRKSDTDEELKAKKQRQMKYLERFVGISLKYSQFLEKKIGDASTGSSKSSVDLNGRKDITQKLQYFKGSLRPYQVEGVTWLTVLFENAINGILADEMGLGKTIQVIALFCHLFERKVNGPFLIVAPLSTLGNWESEFAKFAPKLPVVRFHGYAYERPALMDKVRKTYELDGRPVKPIVLCSYQIPIVEEAFLQSFTWQYLVVDEGQRIKNPESRLSRELRALNSLNRTLLTGTPLQNDIRELWALFNFLMPQIFKDIEAFSSLIDLSDMQDKGKILENEAQNKIISTIHRVLAPFMLRREKKLVLKDVVPKKEVIIYCSLTELQKYLYKAVLQKDMKKLNMATATQEQGDRSKRAKRKVRGNGDEENVSSGNEVYAKNVPVNCPDCPYLINLTMQQPFTMLKKAVNHPYLIWTPLDFSTGARHLLVNEDLVKHSGKLLVLDALLPKLKSNGHKVLIFSTLVMFLDMIEELMLMRGHEYRRLDGTSNFSSRNQGISEFSSDSNVFAFLLSTRAGGLGLNLTSADTVIFMDRDWNPMVDLQAQDRCHRIGQTKPVMIYSLIAKGTCDEMILNRGDIKKRLERVVLKEGTFKTMNKHFDDNTLKELEVLLNNEEKSEKIHANKLVYTDQELDQILDRSDLIQEMKNKAQS